MDNKGETKTQHDLYLQEIEGIDDYWGPTFRYLVFPELGIEFKSNGV